MSELAYVTKEFLAMLKLLIGCAIVTSNLMAQPAKPSALPETSGQTSQLRAAPALAKTVSRKEKVQNFHLEVFQFQGKDLKQKKYSEAKALENYKKIFNPAFRMKINDQTPEQASIVTNHGDSQLSFDLKAKLEADDKVQLATEFHFKGNKKMIRLNASQNLKVNNETIIPLTADETFLMRVTVKDSAI